MRAPPLLLRHGGRPRYVRGVYMDVALTRLRRSRPPSPFTLVSTRHIGPYKLETHRSPPSVS